MSVKIAVPAPEAYSYPLLIKQLFASVGTGDARGEIVQAGAGRFSYREFRDRVGRLAAVLRGLGLKPGDAVAVADWDSHRYLECYFAIPMLGCILQTLNVRLSPDQIIGTLLDTGAKALLLHSDFVPLLPAIEREAHTIEHILLVGEDHDPAPRDHAALEPLVASAAPLGTFPEFDENAIATTFHTTGTTGGPKAVRFSHRQIVLHTLAVAATFGAQPDGEGFRHGDVYMPLTPMFHVHGWGFPYVATMMQAKQVYPGRYLPATILRAKQEEGVTFSHCVPTILQMLLDDPSRDLARGWKIVIGGAVLTHRLRSDAARCGITAFAAYGMSETAPAIAIARTGFGESDDLCRAGAALPLVQARIVDAGMADVPHDDTATGELVLRAPWLTSGYEGNAEASAALWKGGWLHTQDVASIDRAGRITIRDRIKDLIKTGGEWVSPGDLEAIIRQDATILDVAVAGVPDERWGERPVAFVVVAKDYSETRLRSLFHAQVAHGHITKHAVPDRFVQLSSLPRTSVGKINKRALVELAS